MKKTAVKPPKKQFKCNFCQKNLSSKALLQNHVQKLPEQKAVCDVLKPSTSKTFKCEICEQRFLSKQSVKIHTETLHNGKKVQRLQYPI